MTVTEEVLLGLTSLMLVFTLLRLLLVCLMGRFLPSGRLLVFEECMEGRRLVSGLAFRGTWKNRN